MKKITNCKVLRPADFPDCTGNGITAQNSSVTVLVDVPYLYTEFNGKQYYEKPDEKAIEKFCETKKIDKKTVLILCDKTNNPIYSPFLKPLDSVWGVRNGEKLVGPCAGGNYVAVEQNDEGWKEKIFRVHDRYDTERNWEGLSI